MTSSRSEILAAIRRHAVPRVELPTLDGAWIHYADPLTQFVDVLTSVGGTARVLPRSALASAVAELAASVSARKIASLVADAPLGNVDLRSIDDPHALGDLELFVAPGAIGVAENAAVWVDGATLVHQAAAFLTQHLALVLERRAMVQHMHEAYQTLRFDSTGYGVWVSGHSKTADIEQSLVIGAHGPRSLTVLIVDEAS